MKNTFSFTTFIIKIEYNDIRIFITTKTVNYAFVYASKYLNNYTTSL